MNDPNDYHYGEDGEAICNGCGKQNPYPNEPCPHCAAADESE